MARIDQAITSIVEVFMEYADDEGKKGKLSKDELKALLEKEMENPDLKAKIGADDIDEAMDKLDKNNDGEINFGEFSRCVSALAVTYYRKKTGKGDKKGKKREEKEEEK